MKSVKSTEKILFSNPVCYDTCSKCGYYELRGKNKVCHCGLPFTSGTCIKGVIVSVDGKLNKGYNIKYK